MQQLSPAGQQTIDGIAQRYGYSTDAILSMLQSVINGNGSMAQFNHREFAGAGQWMRGGMTMVSDMFNNNLKNSVNNLCSELSQLVAEQPTCFGAAVSSRNTKAASNRTIIPVVAVVVVVVVETVKTVKTVKTIAAVRALTRPAAACICFRVCLCRLRRATPMTGGVIVCAGRTALAPRMASGMRISPRPAAWQSNSMAASRSTTRWTTRSAVFRSNNRMAAHSASTASTA